MEMFVKNQVVQTDPRRRRVYESFRENLDDILEAGLDSGAKIVLSTVAVNLKDCAPFGSVPESDLSPSARATFSKSMQEGSSAMARNLFADARDAFEHASATFPESAEARFQLATALLRQNEPSKALPHFVQAMDADTLPFRADSYINESIRTAARRRAGEALVLCDTAEALNAVSPAGIAGEELFYEHVHANPNGNYQLALAWAASVETLLDAARKRNARTSWISQSECEERIGLTDWNRVSILEDVLRRVQRPPFSDQSGNAQQVARIESQISALRERLTDEAADRAMEVYSRALARAPEDFRVRVNYAEFLEARGQWEAAIAERRKVVALVPKSYFPHYALGGVLKDAGMLKEAREELLKAVALKRDEADVWLELGMVSARQGQWDQARQELQQARDLGSGNPRLALYLGEVLWKLNRYEESLQSLREAVQIAPSDWQPRYRLASSLAQRADFSAAAAEYREVLRLDPGNIRSKIGLAGCLANVGSKPEALRLLDEALQQDPGNRAAIDLQRRVRGW